MSRHDDQRRRSGQQAHYGEHERSRLSGNPQHGEYRNDQNQQFSQDNGYWAQGGQRGYPDAYDPNESRDYYQGGTFREQAAPGGHRGPSPQAGYGPQGVQGAPGAQGGLYGPQTNYGGRSPTGRSYQGGGYEGGGYQGGGYQGGGYQVNYADQHRGYGSPNYGHQEQWNDGRGDYGQGSGYSAGNQADDFDPDYQQWRNEQLRSLDADYRNWRQDRYKKFSDDFSSWRQNQQSGQSGQSGQTGSQQHASSGSGDNSSPSSGAKTK